MKVSFSELDLEQLTQISQGVTNGKAGKKLTEICKTISLSVPNLEFPLIYAGILLARNNQIHDAIEVLKLCQSSAFGDVLETSIACVSDKKDCIVVANRQLA